MKDNRTDQKNEQKVSYEKPLFERQTGMVFTRQVIEEFNGGRFCVQCSSCHGCS